MLTIDTLLESLNEEQREAVLYTDSDALILAGAGSGKTRVLTTKIAYLLTQGYAPYEILALTFTNKAAGEMRERIAGMIGSDLANALTMGTFHSVFSRMLRRYASYLGYESSYTIYDETDARTLVRMIIKEMSLDDKVYKPRVIYGLISKYKNDGLSPRSLGADEKAGIILRQRKIPRFPDIYAAYCERCFRANAMDFDDLLVNMLRLLKSHEEVRQQLHQRFRYILVDEYQDTNRVQHAIVRLLKSPDARICVVGDDAQSIYAFRGAVIDNILMFDHAFADARRFILTKNYRSTDTIVSLAGSLIEKNTKGFRKEIEAVKGEGAKVDLIGSFNASAEAQTIAARLLKRIKSGVSPDDIAILYRMNAQSRLIEEGLRMFGIPYRIFGGLSFFDRKEVKDVLAYLRLVINPNDDEAFRRVYNTPTRGIGAVTFDAINQSALDSQLPLMSVAGSPELLSQVVRPAAARKVTEFVSIIQCLQALKETLGPLEFMKELISQSGIKQMYNDRSIDSESRLENIEELLNALSEYIQHKQDNTDDVPTIESFAREITLYTDRDVEEEDDSPKVTLMTMHAAKGLEYDEVYLVGVEEKIIPSERSLDVEGIEEERRLMYVAITRARERCLISFARERTLHGRTEPASPSRFLYDLDTNHLQDFSGITEQRRRSSSNPIRRMMETSQSFSGVRDSNDVPKKRVLKVIRKVSPEDKASMSGTSEPLRDSCAQVNFEKGDYVYHDRFGRGLVEGFSDSISGDKVHVLFDDGSKKVLIVKFAKLRRE